MDMKENKQPEILENIDNAKLAQNFINNLLVLAGMAIKNHSRQEENIDLNKMRQCLETNFPTNKVKKNQDKVFILISEALDNSEGNPKTYLENIYQDLAKEDWKWERNPTPTRLVLTVHENKIISDVDRKLKTKIQTAKKTILKKLENQIQQLTKDEDQLTMSVLTEKVTIKIGGPSKFFNATSKEGRHPQPKQMTVEQILEKDINSSFVTKKTKVNSEFNKKPQKLKTVSEDDKNRFFKGLPPNQNETNNYKEWLKNAMHKLPAFEPK